MSWVAKNSFKGSLDGILNNAVIYIVTGIFLTYYDDPLAEKMIGLSIMAAITIFMVHWLIQQLHARLQKIERAQFPDQPPIDTSQKNYLAWGFLAGILIGLTLTGLWHAARPYEDSTGPGRWKEDWVFYIFGLAIGYVWMIILSWREAKRLRQNSESPLP